MTRSVDYDLDESNPLKIFRKTMKGGKAFRIGVNHKGFYVYIEGGGKMPRVLTGSFTHYHVLEQKVTAYVEGVKGYAKS